MAADVENACCATWKKKYSKLVEKYSKLEELKNKFRDCTSLVNEKYDVLEKENGSQKQALGDLKVEANRWKAEKEQEYAIRVDLEDEISALKDEIQLLQQNGKSSSHESDRKLQECLNVAEKDIDQLKELLEKERGRADLEKKNAEIERKKANETLKKVEMGKNKANEAQKAVDIERKRAEENRLLWERLKTEIDEVKSKLGLERSKLEAANKKVKEEMENTLRERKRAGLALTKAEEQRELAEMNLKKATVEKDRADDLAKKLEEERNRTEKLTEELHRLCSGKLVEATVNRSNTGRESELTSDVGSVMVKREALMSQGKEKIVVKKHENIIREKRCVDLEMKKAKKLRKVAESHKKKAMEKKQIADQLSRELEGCKLSLEELLKELQELISCRTHVDNPLVRYNSDISDRDAVKLLKKELKLEKMLVKHAKEVTKVEILRNNMLHQELFHLKQECRQFQQRLDKLDDCFPGDKGIHESEKVGNKTFTKKFCSDRYRRHNVSGIDSRLDPLYRGSNQKVLQSSAIYSSSASFSDLPLMGTQERAAFSVTKSAKLREDKSNLKRTMSRLSDKTRTIYRENAVKKAENSIRNPIKDNANKRRVGRRDKRKILDAVESIGILYSKDQKLHEQVSEKLSVLCGILNGQKDDAAEQNLLEFSCREHVRPLKRRKTSCEGTMMIHPLRNSGEPKGIQDSVIEGSNIGMGASPPGLGVKFDQCLKDGMGNILGSNECIQLDFDEMAIYDCMKLLDLDNVADENSYRRAIAMPLSPTLPEIEFQMDGVLEVDKPKIPVEQSSQEELANVKDDVAPTCSSDIIDMEKDPTLLILKNPDIEHASDALSHQIQVVGGKSGKLDVTGSGNEETRVLCESRIASIPDDLPKFFVLSSENRNGHGTNGMLRILLAIRRCMPQRSLLPSADAFLQSILLSLLKAEDLSSKEKVCVFFSIILHEISEIEMTNLTNVLNYDIVQSLDSLTLQICSALSDLVLRRILMELCDLFELLALIEDFLLQRKVLVCSDIYAELPVICGFKVNLVLDGITIMLSEQAASVRQLVAGGCLLASLSLGMDHIGFVCETSCNIFTMQKFDPVEVLAILHAFAHLCGSKYFTLQQYSVAMAVVKSLVMFLEKQSSATNFASTSPSLVKTPSKIWSCCTNCPFLEGAISMENIALLLLEKLQTHVRSVSWPQESHELVNWLVPTVCCYEQRTKEVSGLKENVQLSTTSDKNMCNFIDILSLVEILASFMNWEWTSDNIIAQLCELLESCVTQSFSAAIIILLGQLGRLGVDTNGYEDTRVGKLRQWLSAFFCQRASIKLSIANQFAIMTALLGLTPRKFEELVIESQVESPSITSRLSIPANYIRQWFSSLSKEQQSFFKLHHAASQTSFRIGFPPKQKVV